MKIPRRRRSVAFSTTVIVSRRCPPPPLPRARGIDIPMNLSKRFFSFATELLLHHDEAVDQPWSLAFATA